MTAEPQVDEPIDRIAAFIEYVSRLATSERVRQRLAGAAVPLVTPSELVALRALADAGPLTSGNLAAALALDRTTVSRTGARLLELGLVRREVDTDDKRRAWLELTPKGREILHGQRAVSRQYYEVATSEWTDQERADAGRLVARLQDCLLRLEFDDAGRAVGLAPAFS